MTGINTALDEVSDEESLRRQRMGLRSAAKGNKSTGQRAAEANVATMTSKLERSGLAYDDPKAQEARQAVMLMKDAAAFRNATADQYATLTGAAQDQFKGVNELDPTAPQGESTTDKLARLKAYRPTGFGGLRLNQSTIDEIMNMRDIQAQSQPIETYNAPEGGGRQGLRDLIKWS